MWLPLPLAHSESATAPNAELDITIATDVILLCLPPNNTHVLQHLDVAVYKSLKSLSSKLINKAWLLKSDIWVSREFFSAIFMNGDYFFWIWKVWSLYIQPQCDR